MRTFLVGVLAFGFLLLAVGIVHLLAMQHPLIIFTIGGH